MYIRTKDGVYKIDEVKPYFLDEKQKLFINNELKVAINEQRVINQSESLEELCDEYVLLERNAKPIIFKTLRGAINNKIYDDETIYGAIWASKGLIYVAKMNEKGELELL